MSNLARPHKHFRFLYVIFCFMFFNDLNAQIQITIPENPVIIYIPNAIRGANQVDADWNLTWNEFNTEIFKTEYQKMYPGVLRWPGGTNGNNYDWQERMNHPELFHLGNCIHFIKEMNLELQYMVNFGIGSAHDAANFARLLRSNNIYWVNKRNSLFGDTARIETTMWELGNEIGYTHAWDKAWFSHAKNECINFRDGSFKSFTDYLADSLYYYGGSLWRGGWVDSPSDPNYDCILGEKYLVQGNEGDTIYINASFPEIGHDSVKVWIVHDPDFQIDNLTTEELYHNITEPDNLLDSGLFSFTNDTFFIHVGNNIIVDENDLIYIEYETTGHDGAFAFRDSIKQIDPNIEIGYEIIPDDSLFNQSFFLNDFSNHPPDFFIKHTYPGALKIQTFTKNNLFSEIPYFSSQLAQMIQEYQTYIDSMAELAGITENIGIALTEWASHLPNACDTCQLAIFDGVIGAMSAASLGAYYIELLVNNSIDLRALNYFELYTGTYHTGSSLYKRNSFGDFSVTSQGHALRLLYQVAGTKMFLIDTAWVSGNSQIDIWAYENYGHSNNIEELSVPALKIYGGIDSTYNDYSVFLINRDDSLGYNVTFSIPASWNVDSAYTETIFGIPSDSTFSIEYDTIENVSNNIQFFIKPFSIATIRFNTDTIITSNQSSTNHDFFAYPNPSKTSIYIEGTALLDADFIILYDLSGRILEQKRVNKRITEINISNYPKGMYLIKISGLNHSSVYKFIKE